MLENKEQEKIAGIISDFFDGAVNEADIDILAMKIYEKYVAKLEQDLEFTTKTANELIEIKHKLEQELAKLKEMAIVPKFKHHDYVYAIYSDKDIFKGQIDIFDYYTKEYLVFFSEDIGNDWFSENLLFATEQEAQAKLKDHKHNSQYKNL